METSTFNTFTRTQHCVRQTERKFYANITRSKNNKKNQTKPKKNENKLTWTYSPLLFDITRKRAAKSFESMVIGSKKMYFVYFSLLLLNLNISLKMFVDFMTIACSFSTKPIGQNLFNTCMLLCLFAFFFSKKRTKQNKTHIRKTLRNDLHRCQCR